MHYKFDKNITSFGKKKNRSVGNLFYNVQKYRDGFGITRAVLFLFSQACSGQGAICDSK